MGSTKNIVFIIPRELFVAFDEGRIINAPVPEGESPREGTLVDWSHQDDSGTALVVSYNLGFYCKIRKATR